MSERPLKIVELNRQLRPRKRRTAGYSSMRCRRGTTSENGRHFSWRTAFSLTMGFRAASQPHAVMCSAPHVS
ncbi:hypothetical protein GCK32_021995 [Trichostrongylus colubriformis]|uniref:Uncharacterized protein n=1 Tax=Trichostrongylus colubriformis TaxID=6319 RepID=A0AAN8IV51_TRICO